MRGLDVMTPDKPFFLYVSYGATHAPHHVSQEWIDKYKGKFDKGWDAVRDETLRQHEGQGPGARGHRADRPPRRRRSPGTT